MTALGFGQGGFGLGPFGIATGGCTPFLRDPTGKIWQLIVQDNGRIQTIGTVLKLFHIQDPIMGIIPHAFSLSADTVGRIISTPLNPPTIQTPQLYIPLQSSNGSTFKLTISNEGRLFVTPTNSLLPDAIPYIPDVSMSKWPDTAGVVCSSCQNSTVTVSADLSCWCCSCNAFIPDEDTNLIVVLDE